MLTVRETLSLPVFATARLVAGETGLDREVVWVHIIDIPDAHYEWNREGVLLLTAGYGLRDDPERQAALIPQLVEKGFAGMVLSTGYYFDHAPAEMGAAADRLDFPLIETPPDLLFIDVTEAVLERIVNRQYMLRRQADEIHTRLTELVLEGGDLGALANTLARILGRAVTIEDATFRVLASAQEGGVDAARQRSVAHGRTTPEVAERLLAQGIYDRLLAEMGPVQVDPLPELGMTMARIVAPIIVAHEIYGYIWIIAGNRPFTALDELAVGHGATVAALILFKEQAVSEAEEARRDDLLAQLLQGAPLSPARTEEARQLGYRLDQPHQVLLIQGRVRSGGSLHTLSGEVAAWLAQRSERPLLAWRDRHLLLLLESASGTQGQVLGETLAGALVAALDHPACRLLVGVGRPHGPAPDAVRRSFEEAQEALRVAHALGRKSGTISFANLGLLHWLHHLPAVVAEENAYLQHVRALAAYDAEHQSDLLPSLRAYLDQGGSLVDGATVLYIHRNTLLHRLKRIEELLDLDLRDPFTRLNLHVAVTYYRLA